MLVFLMWVSVQEIRNTQMPVIQSHFRSLPLEERIAHRARGLARRPTHIPVILERGGEEAPELSCERFLFTPTLTGSQLHFVVRRQVKLEAQQALFLLCHGHIIHSETTVLDLYERYRDLQDGFLYISFALENTFG